MKSQNGSTNSGGEDLNFEEALSQLEKIVNQLESGELGLTKTLEKYEEGVGRLRQCYQLLKEAEGKIEVIVGLKQNGEPEAEPFELSNDSPEQKLAKKSTRRSSRSDLES